MSREQVRASILAAQIARESERKQQSLRPIVPLPVKRGWYPRTSRDDSAEWVQGFARDKKERG